MTQQTQISPPLRFAALLLCWFAAFAASCAPHQSQPLPSAGERGPAVGVDLCWFVVDDDPFDDNLKVGEAPRALPPSSQPLAEVLSAYANRVVPVTPANRALWRANGMRLISVPRKDLDHLKETLRLVGSIQQERVGESTRWMPAINSPHWDGTKSIVLDDGPLSLGAGSLRMLMRCWIGPASPEVSAQIASDPARRLGSGEIAGAIQLEMVPQHVDKPAPEDIAAVLKPKPSQEAQGVVFSRLLLEASLTTDDLLLIVPERPDAEWRPRKSADGLPSVTEPLGPPVPASPTLGELLLTDLAVGGHRNAKLVLVIAPSPPKKFNLLAQK